jgi:hypothetical protein
MEEYEYLIDDALHILLRLVGMSGGVPVTTLSAEHLHVDAVLPEGTFDLELPAGTRVVQVTRPG